MLRTHRWKALGAYPKDHPSGERCVGRNSCVKGVCVVTLGCLERGPGPVSRGAGEAFSKKLALVLLLVILSEMKVITSIIN